MGQHQHKHQHQHKVTLNQPAGGTPAPEHAAPVAAAPASAAPEVALTPAQQLLQDAKKTVTLEPDAEGRVFVLKKPGSLQQLRLLEGLGMLTANPGYMAVAQQVQYLVSIDGEVLTPVTNKIQLEALVQRLDDHGIYAVAAGVEEHWGGQQKTPEQAAEALKN